MALLLYKLDAHLFLGPQLVPQKGQSQPFQFTATAINRLLSITIDYCRHGVLLYIVIAY